MQIQNYIVSTWKSIETDFVLFIEISPIHPKKEKNELAKPLFEM